MPASQCPLSRVSQGSNSKAHWPRVGERSAHVVVHSVPPLFSQRLYAWMAISGSLQMPWPAAISQYAPPLAMQTWQPCMAKGEGSSECQNMLCLLFTQLEFSIHTCVRKSKNGSQSKQSLPAPQVSQTRLRSDPHVSSDKSQVWALTAAVAVASNSSKRSGEEDEVFMTETRGGTNDEVYCRYVRSNKESRSGGSVQCSSRVVCCATLSRILSEYLTVPK